MATAQSAITFAVCILMITELILAKKDYYDILGVPKDATERQIKKAFHKLAMKYHPDKNKNPDAEMKFREIAEAYETLLDNRRRREYDQFGHAAHFNGETQGRQRNNVHHPFSFNYDDMFKDFDIYSQNRHARQRRNFEEQTRSHPEANSQHKRPFQGGFGSGVFDDTFEDLERMFTFERHSKQTNRFQGASKQHCRTVTQRRGNMVTTYTDCTGS
ncbi:dnaJ homolog subfamily B member 9a [Lampris incognitus]|uniref:dnaJ homolog subfamily B member 9a n=1 Tax=Lampris incognitus TaxID=2546036 RepID=UPI0024B563D4|nr:dnaJ homolog subfamily B member 9a [Lampris incognitus]XP_056137550.1 dnaJ homolog subfamily B member 9a [Lampris incognitus]